MEVDKHHLKNGVLKYHHEFLPVFHTYILFLVVNFTTSIEINRYGVRLLAHRHTRISLCLSKCTSSASVLRSFIFWFVSTSIMYQHTSIGDIIGMVILDLEVIDLYGAFQDFVLDLLDNSIFAIDQDQDITGLELTCIFSHLIFS